MLKKLTILIALLVLAGFALASIRSNDNEVHSGDVNTPNVNINWNGVWTQTDDSDAFTAVATINDGVISINLNSPSGSALYWEGTWPAMPSQDVQTIKSVANREALDASLLGSQDDTKDFKYEKDVLSFKFTALGVTQTIHLKHDA